MMFIWVASSAVLFLCGVEAKNTIRCSNHTGSSTTLKESNDGVKARYVLEWCTLASPIDTEWSIHVHYDRYNRNPKFNTKFIHSAKTEYLNWEEPLSCDYVCLSTSLDLMFNSSYTIQNWLPKSGSKADFSNHHIRNKYTRENFTTYNVKGSHISHVDYVSVSFFLDKIPADDYFVQLCKTASNESIGHQEDYDDCEDISDKCSSPSVYDIQCKLHIPNGDFRVVVNFIGAWTRGDFLPLKSYYRDISLVAAESPPLSDSTGRRYAWALWAGGVLGALGAAAALLVLALRWRRSQHYRKQVLRDWLHREETKQVEASPQPPGPILLLYARECSAAEPIIGALKALLETAAPGQVHDICSAETQALSAEGGGAWVRAMLARPDSRVVLLQTPALQALHTPRMVTKDGVPRLEQPLLSSRAVYRVPAPADWLLQFALRLLAETAHRPQVYRKYYLATLEGLETEALQYTVPFRRYVLPRHADTLLQDLQPQSQSQTQSQSQSQPVDELARAIIDFVDYSRANPDYLMEELLIL